MSDSPFLYPNVTAVPSQSEYRPRKDTEGAGKGEFDQVFEKALAEPDSKVDLNQVRQPLKFSAHATQRLKDRKIALDPATMAKVNDAVDRAQAKGVEDTLVLTSNAALIVNVKNRTVVTALDRNSLAGNVFTNIDGAIVL
jgi:flagellar operon protein